jgi:hypothetical protein
MSFIQRHVVTVTVDAAGDGIGYSPALNGKVSQIRYVKTDYANGVDFTITAEATGETIWSQLNVNASVTVAPRQAIHDTAGVAGLYAAGALANDRVKIVVAQGGVSTSGTFHIVME